MQARTKSEVARLLEQHKGEVLMLDLGCGDRKQENHIGMDVRALKGVDVVHDLEKTPWPFPSETFTLVSASHVLEHVNPANMGFIRVMNEIWRVLKYEGQLRVATPYGGSTMWKSDPTHLIQLIPQTFAHFDPLHALQTYHVYQPKPWKIHSCFWSVDGNMEVLLSKRREDPSYLKV